MEMEIELLDHQMSFMSSEKPVTIMIAGRGSGKSFVAGMKIASLLLQGHSVLGIAQNYKMVKKVLLKAIEDALNIMGRPYVKNISDMTITIGKATFHGFSAENVEGPRGLTNIKALVIDEAALTPKELFDVACACLRGAGKPEIYLISTPRGRGNWLNPMINDDSNEVIRATTYDNEYLDDSFVKLLESQYDEDFAKQELFGEILDTDEPNQLIKTELLNKGIGNAIIQDNWKIVFGVDCARFGKDNTVIVVRIGKHIADIEKLAISDTHDIVRLVEKYERKYGKDNVDQINIDTTGGFGAGPFDLLKLNRNNVVAVEFGASSPDPHLKNIRTYIYQLAIDYFARDGKIGYDTELFDELIAQEYSINLSGKKQLSPKENIKQKLGRSPDTSDAFCLSLLTEGDMFIKKDKSIAIVNNIMFTNRLKNITKKTAWKND